MAPDTNYVLRRDSIAAASTGGNGLAGSAPLRRGALERPGQVRDDQEQRQGRQQNCKDDLLHSNLNYYCRYKRQTVCLGSSNLAAA